MPKSCGSVLARRRLALLLGSADAGAKHHQLRSCRLSGSASLRALDPGLCAVLCAWASAGLGQSFWKGEFH
ncbi:unnamed protein product, partial [Effrenium voratum]